MEFLPEIISSYSLENTEKEPKLLSDLNRETWANVMIPRMLSGHLQGRVLSMISKMIHPTNIIEVGTYTGYSALCMAEGLKENGKIHTLDINEEYTSVAKKYFDKSEYKENILNSFQGTEWNGERVSVEISKPPSGNSRNSNDDKRSFKKSSSKSRDNNFKSKSEKPKSRAKSSSSGDKNSFKSRFSESKRKRR